MGKTCNSGEYLPAVSDFYRQLEILTYHSLSDGEVEYYTLVFTLPGGQPRPSTAELESNPMSLQTIMV